MSNCQIRFATRNDIPLIMDYIDKYWKRGHILATDKTLFEWQYIHYGKVTMIVAEDVDGSIQGILGYIPYSDGDDKDISLALWKANHSEDFLGIRLLMYLRKEEKHRNIICPGINLGTTSKIYTSMGMKIGTMNQWYRLTYREKYDVAYINNPEIPDVKEPDGYTLKKIERLENLQLYDFESNNTCPMKSRPYFIKRYFNHPMYEYMVYALCDEKDITQALVVLRAQEHNTSKIYRFVDYLGPSFLISKLTYFLDIEMQKYNIEYIDMYETGLKSELLVEAGWKLVKESGNIIPNYFSPYEQRVVDINYCTSDPTAIMFRGDGDQDRPN